MAAVASAAVVYSAVTAVDMGISMLLWNRQLAARGDVVTMSLQCREEKCPRPGASVLVR